MEQSSSSSIETCSLLSIWPESERLQIALNSSEGAKNHQYTLPKIKYEFTTAFNSGTNVSLDQTGLLALINNGFLRDALFMTTKLLSSLGQGIGTVLRPSQINLSILELWSCRFQLMFVLKYYEQLQEELTPFGELDAPDLFYEYYASYSQNKGSMVPFSFRLVHAESISFSATPHQSIQRVHQLKLNVHKVIDTITHSNPNAPELSIWQERLFVVKTMYARVLFRIKEYQKSLFAYEQILNELSDNEKPKRKMLLSNLIRMAMYIGDKKRMENYIQDVVNLLGIDNNESSDMIAFSCFKCIFEGNYSKALEIMQQFKMDKPEIFKLSELCNNEAICLLYNGRALECLQMLFNHAGLIEEPLALNLATVSDLVCTNSQVLKQNYLSKHSQDNNDLFDPVLMRIP